MNISKQKINQDNYQSGVPFEGSVIKDRFTADDIFKRLTASATEEVRKKSLRLFFSGFAAGLILGSTFMGRAVMTNAFPEYANLLGNILYPIGFIAIVLGGYQLFTENTLTPVTLILNRRASIIRLLRLWGIVLLANISGAGVGAFLMARTGIFDSDVAQTAMQFGEHALSYSWADLFF